MAAASHSLPRERALLTARLDLLQDIVRPEIPQGSRCPQGSLHASGPGILAELLLAVRGPPRPLNRSRRTAGREIEVLLS
jgi:hypothetical protein